jgi:tetratricopeptide (TPR) repeat protein
VTSFHLPFLPPEALADEGSIAIAATRAIALAKGGDTRAALNLALQARRRAQGLEMDLGELEALNAAAIVHLIRGDAISAVASALDACHLARRAGSRARLGHAQVSLEMAAWNLAATDQVTDTLDRCAREGMELGDAALEIRARVGLGVVLGDSGRFDAAGREFRRALPLAVSIPNPTGAARVVANLANLNRKQAAAHFAAGFEALGLHASADCARLADQACRMAVEEGNVSVEIDALAIHACALEMRGDPERARVLLRASIALGRGARCPSAVLWVLCELGRLALAAGDLGEARRAYADAFDVSRELRPTRKIARACSGIADVAAREGDVPAANLWRERAAEEEAAFEIASLQTRSQIRQFFS